MLCFSLLGTRQFEADHPPTCLPCLWIRGLLGSCESGQLLTSLSGCLTLESGEASTWLRLDRNWLEYKYECFLNSREIAQNRVSEEHEESEEEAAHPGDCVYTKLLLKLCEIAQNRDSEEYEDSLSNTRVWEIMRLNRNWREYIIVLINSREIG